MWQLQLQTQDVRAVAGQIYVWFHLNFPNQPILALLVGEKKQISVLLDCLRASFSRVNMWWDGQLIAYECQKGCKKLFMHHYPWSSLDCLVYPPKGRPKRTHPFLGQRFYWCSSWFHLLVYILTCHAFTCMTVPVCLSSKLFFIVSLKPASGFTQPAIWGCCWTPCLQCWPEAHCSGFGICHMCAHMPMKKNPIQAQILVLVACYIYMCFLIGNQFTGTHAHKPHWSDSFSGLGHRMWSG